MGEERPHIWGSWTRAETTQGPAWGRTFHSDRHVVPGERQEGLDVSDFPTPFPPGGLKFRLPLGVRAGSMLGSPGSYGEKTESESGHVSMRPCGQVCASQDQSCRLCCQCVSVGSEAPGARSLQGAPQVPGCRAFLHREEVAVQRCGVTAGTEVHRCLGAVGRLQREREVLCAWSGDAVPIGNVSLHRGGSSS